MVDPDRIPVLDLFAGPGGLGEGFARCRVGRRRPFSIALSVEMEEHAHRTLRLRSFYRQYPSPSAVPRAFYRVLRGEIPAEALEEVCPDKWQLASEEALQAELGDEAGNAAVDERIQGVQRRAQSRPLVLIGGPPCQAYSLVGRARQRGVKDFEDDPRHQLYLQYLRVIASTWPAVFVMENVKGILSSRLRQERIFPRILEDLHDPLRALDGAARSSESQRYRLVPVTETPGATGLFGHSDYDPRDFVLRCEEYGAPQRRHRVFIVGLREDLRGSFEPIKRAEHLTVRDVIGRVPKLRSGLSPRDQNGDWQEAIREGVTTKLLESVSDVASSGVAGMMEKVAAQIEGSELSRGSEFLPCEDCGIEVGEAGKWIVDDRIEGLCNHSARSHMKSDLLRYLFASCYAQQEGESPTLAEFPSALMPNHRNAGEAARDRSLFADRFRVQVWDRPSTTITSHISKDGHYFIHPDPEQCRSLTVREAARLQTFPDNYYFCGPRTSQYIQVGNAVPPLIASRIAASVFGFLSDSGAA
jgi:DNA (cytosine-5)-methyltransferase 1